ncbi:MAG: M20/M25/M40 family metallo-hydrolase [Bacteroidota bacterium]
MKIKLTLLFIAFAAIAFAQKKELQTITESDLKAHLEFIASDYMQGRDFNTETPGLEITADYLKTQCEKMGLKPGGKDYFQSLEMVALKPDSENTFMKLIDEEGNATLKDGDIFALGGSANGDTIKGEIVFAGYGWYDDKTKYNDTEGLDIKDKIVLVMTRTPQLVSEDKKSDMSIEMKKMSKAVMGGAKALIFVPDPTNPDDSWLESIKKYATGGTYSLQGTKSRPPMRLSLLFGTEKLGDEIIKESGNTLSQIQKVINDSGEPKSFDVKNVTANIQLAKKSLSVDGKNVVAVIEGSDPVLKNECVLFTAHYDHVGMTSDGEVNNGADDNGTGTVALLEIAEAFQSMKKKPKRSIVFAWVTAEEKGLIGSDYYSQNPVIPLENTVVDINLDMVGRSAEKEPEKGAELNKSLAGPNGLYIVSGNQSSELMKISDAVCKDLGLIPSDELTKSFLTRSDYYHFYKNGVPILGLSTGLHEDYHKPTDELDKIDYNKMKRIADYCFLVANKVANQKKRIVVDNPAK